MIDDDIINLQQILNEGTKMLQATNGTYLSKKEPKKPNMFTCLCESAWK